MLILKIIGKILQNNLLYDFHKKKLLIYHIQNQQLTS